ncbi:MAG: DUF3685 domain-containing protein [Cyanobacteriota bacterium]|nr:DUF3685 domain-containing protein [Cyanobacteriota bacterium]
MSDPQRRASSGPLPPLLLLADPLSREGLRRWLTLDPPRYRLVDSPDQLEGVPRLVIWTLTSQPSAPALVEELRQLQERWHPCPVLLILSSALRLPRDLLLNLSLPGLLQGPDPATLREAVDTLLAGGRVVELMGDASDEASGREPFPMGLGQWLLVSGLQQIDAELRVCVRLLDPPPTGWLAILLLQGRRRELLVARSLLLWLWGPLTMAWGWEAPAAAATAAPEPGAPALALTLSQRNADGIWEALRGRLRAVLLATPENATGQLLASDGLRAERRRDLLLALLEQLETLRQSLRVQDQPTDSLLQRWTALQPALRQQALRQMAGPYVQLPREGTLRPVADTLLSQSDLSGDDPELPNPETMLAALFQARPLVVEGRLRAADEPQAVLYLEMLLANWLVRSAERISGEVLALSAEWPELRAYLLRDNLLSTRNLERLRNQLNAQERWFEWVRRPIRLYESRRPLFSLQREGIRLLESTEPRDAELKRLRGPQQLITLLMELRDALAPQVQSVVRALGQLVVVLLTRVIGRAIGLVGRGIAQGMGRGLER